MQGKIMELKAAYPTKSACHVSTRKSRGSERTRVAIIEFDTILRPHLEHAKSPMESVQGRCMRESGFPISPGARYIQDNEPSQRHPTSGGHFEVRSRKRAPQVGIRDNIQYRA